VLQAVVPEIFSSFPVPARFNSRTAQPTTNKAITVSFQILNYWSFQNICPSYAMIGESFIKKPSSSLSLVDTIIQESEFH
jgi:hypothetical protein